MISTGSCITVKNDPLSPTGIEQVLSWLTSPGTDLSSRIKQLRSIREIDRDAYKRLKVQLPYIVCGTFDPPIRRTENFASADSFIIDIDAASENGRDVDELFATICGDSRVALAFRSPSMDGIKVMFKFAEKCYDASLYSLFYKAFATTFSRQYNLEGLVDMRVSDVCRACFLSVDPCAYHNPCAEPVRLGDYLPLDDTQALSDLKHELVRVEKQAVVRMAQPAHTSDPADAVIDRIKAVLAPRNHKPVNRDVYVPAAIDEVKSGIKETLENVGLTVTEMRNIQYGVKVMMKAGMRCAEINVFYGKRGYSVVETPKKGTSQELNVMTGKLIRSYLCPETCHEAVI